MFKAPEGSSARLVQLCVLYFLFYAVTGVTVKYFQGSAAHGYPGMNDVQFLVYSTSGGMGICLVVALAKGWFRLKSNGHLQWGPLSFPREYLYIVPSGVCTAVVIPTTTLMYSLPISVMVAMVMMRGSVIVISRAVDAIQVKQKILHKKVFWQEDAAVLVALGGMSIQLFGAKPGDFAFVHNAAAVTILGSYIVAYAIRIYIMNYYKNTRGKGVALDNEGFFGVEQITAFIVIVIVAAALFFSKSQAAQLVVFRGAIVTPKAKWPLAILAGTAFGMVAFFSVFIFMFKGRTATFAGLVNRLTSLLAGTFATIVSYLAFGGKFPKRDDWISLLFILAAVGFLTVAERRRAAELVAKKEVASIPEPAEAEVPIPKAQGEGR